MKRAMITVKQGDITLKVPADTVATTFISAALAQVGASQRVAANYGAIPGLGEYWPGEGGHNAGLMRGENGEPDYYLIVPGIETDGSHTYGGYEHKTVGADSHNDGLSNTLALLADSKDHPAAKFASSYAADGHSDFYLPARRELRLAEITVPDLFAKAYYWSSTQSSANDAFSLDFEGGWQSTFGKDVTRLVRPVRRKYL